MSEKITPALTAEEWKRKERGTVYLSSIHGDVVVLSGEESATAAPDDRHALAALALYGQPFGFTHEDVKVLHVVAERILDANLWDTDPERIESIADRIAALLPEKK